MAMPSDAEVDQLGQGIDAIPELSGAGIGFLGDDTSTVLRRSAHVSGLNTYVVLEEQDVPPPPAPPPEPSLSTEIINTVLNCGSAVAGASAMVAEPFAGPAVLLEPFTFIVLRAAQAQCMISAGRLTDIVFNNGSWSRWMDSSEFYYWAATELDLVSLAGAAASASAAVRAAKAIQRATGRSWATILKGLSRAERKRLTKELIRLKRPDASGGALKELVQMGTFPRRLTATQIDERLFNQLKDILSATMSLASSANSGVLRMLYIHIIQE
jgi:hypothetical protein